MVTDQSQLEEIQLFLHNFDSNGQGILHSFIVEKSSNFVVTSEWVYLMVSCVCDARVHLLEEQLRETETRAASLLEEEQRRSREIVVRI